jgi:hypothetical protein
MTRGAGLFRAAGGLSSSSARGIAGGAKRARRAKAPESPAGRIFVSATRIQNTLGIAGQSLRPMQPGFFFGALKKNAPKFLKFFTLLTLF